MKKKRLERVLEAVKIDDLKCDKEGLEIFKRRIITLLEPFLED